VSRLTVRFHAARFQIERFQNVATRVRMTRHASPAGLLVHENCFRSDDFLRRIGLFTGIDVLLRETVGPTA
jgi:hypothetical protein